MKDHAVGDRAATAPQETARTGVLSPAPLKELQQKFEFAVARVVAAAREQWKAQP